MTKLITLAKRLYFSDEIEYFDYCIESYVNGNFSQCEELFQAMSRKDQKDLLNYINYTLRGNVNMMTVYRFYFNLL